MEIIETPIKDLVILQPKVFEDERGYFMESYKSSFFEQNFPEIRFVQDNESASSYGVLRGLHFQKPPFEQTKLVRVVEGEVLDVAVDLRTSSDSFGSFFSVHLSAKNKKQFLIPKGFAHGFVVLSKTAIFSYKVDNYYSAESDGGIVWNDPTLNIDWGVAEQDLIISQKDKALPKLQEFMNSNPF